MNKKIIREVFESISPFLINPTKTSITIGMSKRFFLFQMLNKLMKEIEEDPYLNFISVIKNYDLIGRVLHGTVKDMYRDRNKFYFRRFFVDKELYEFVKKDIEELYPKYKDIKVILSRHGTIIYDNYKNNEFNVLLLTVHAGQWVPQSLSKKMKFSRMDRFSDEDIDSDKLYSKVVLDKGGIWVNTKLSRFVCDVNRSKTGCIYYKKNEKWIHNKVWGDLNKKDVNMINSWHSEFYLTLEKLLEAYAFNIIFDGHTMKNKQGRPKISIATRHIPSFYRPIVRSMRGKFKKLKYKPIYFNKPYSGGFILRWLKEKFPDRFIFSMEVNKKLYMTPDRKRTFKRKLKKLKEDMPKIFDLE